MLFLDKLLVFSTKKSMVYAGFAMLTAKTGEVSIKIKMILTELSEAANKHIESVDIYSIPRS